MFKNCSLHLVAFGLLALQESLHSKCLSLAQSSQSNDDSQCHAARVASLLQRPKPMETEKIANYPAPTHGPKLCTWTCPSDGDGYCDDSGPGASSDTCTYGTDCTDCGARKAREYHSAEIGCLKAVSGAPPISTLAECELAIRLWGRIWGGQISSPDRPKGCVETWYGAHGEGWYNTHPTGASGRVVHYGQMCVQPKCSEYACRDGWFNKPGNASFACFTDPCTKEECCDQAQPTPRPTPRPLTCSRYACRDGWLNKPGQASITCSADPCTKEECCDQARDPSRSSGGGKRPWLYTESLPGSIPSTRN